MDFLLIITPPSLPPYLPSVLPHVEDLDLDVAPLQVSGKQLHNVGLSAGGQPDHGHEQTAFVAREGEREGGREEGV